MPLVDPRRALGTSRFNFFHFRWRIRRGGTRDAPPGSKLFHYRPQRSWGKVIGYIFTGICHSVNRGGVPAWGGCLLGGGGCLLLGVSAPWVSAPGGVCSGMGCLLRGLSAPGGSAFGGGWWRPPQDGHCCGILLECILVFMQFSAKEL